jgi:hypothetical protein
VVKYVLDKRWIFYDETRGARRRDGSSSSIPLMGVATTAIFWVTETAFWLIWGTDFARETGAVLGLMVGYTTKYLLDRRFVFHDARGRMTRLSGWGRTPVAECRVQTARSAADVARALSEGPLIARGNGRSYGDPAMSSGLTLAMTGMDRMLSFDAKPGSWWPRPGCSGRHHRDLPAARLVSRLVTPGTKFITLGGAIAADVHGKNHHGPAASGPASTGSR